VDIFAIEIDKGIVVVAMLAASHRFMNLCEPLVKEGAFKLFRKDSSINVFTYLYLISSVATMDLRQWNQTHLYLTLLIESQLNRGMESNFVGREERRF